MPTLSDNCKKAQSLSRMTRKELYEKCKEQITEIQKLNLFQEEKKEDISTEVKLIKLKELNEEMWTECSVRGKEILKLNHIIIQRDKQLSTIAHALMNNPCHGAYDIEDGVVILSTD